MDVKDWMKRLVLGVAALGVASLAAATLVVSGILDVPSAQATPSDEEVVGFGHVLVEAEDGRWRSSEKSGSMIAMGTTLEDVFGATGEKAATHVPKPPPPRASAPQATRSSTGSSDWSSARASWYGPGFYGNTMAGGGTLTTDSMVVAHKTMAFGTRIQFEYNGRTCTAVVQDRGPFIAGRVFDLGPGTARALGFSGVGTVRYRILGR